jgi:hypothetical protein
MAYVDLTPIRASLCNTPKATDHISIKERIAPSFDLKKATDDAIKQQRLQPFSLPLKPLTILERLSINRQNGRNKASSLKSVTPRNSLKNDET